MRPTLHQKTLSLVRERIKDRGWLARTAKKLDIPYNRIWQWEKRNGESKLDPDSIQLLYEHLTGKELDY